MKTKKISIFMGVLTTAALLAFASCNSNQSPTASGNQKDSVKAATPTPAPAAAAKIMNPAFLANAANIAINMYCISKGSYMAVNTTTNNVAIYNANNTGSGSYEFILAAPSAAITSVSPISAPNYNVVYFEENHKHCPYICDITTLINNETVPGNVTQYNAPNQTLSGYIAAFNNLSRPGSNLISAIALNNQLVTNLFNLPQPATTIIVLIGLVGPPGNQNVIITYVGFNNTYQQVGASVDTNPYCYFNENS